MELHIGSLYWPTTLAVERDAAPPKASQDEFDIVIVGAGMSGVLTAYLLASKGYRIAIVDKRQAASGSTEANTGLLQYSNDIMLHELIEQIGAADAVDFYTACLDAMGRLKEIARLLPGHADFVSRPSIYYASTEDDKGRLEKEYEALSKYGFPAEFWNHDKLLEKTGIDKPAAIVTHGDAEVNPYKFANGVLSLAQELGAVLYEHTEVLGMEETKGGIAMETSAGKLRAKHAIFTTGYEAPPEGSRNAAILNRSYVAVTKPLETDAPWHENALIWETATPYLYIRTTAENRVIIGGLDEQTDDMPSEGKVREYGQKLVDEANGLIPGLAAELDYAYCAVFGESSDNLPFIGRHPKLKNAYYLLGYGGNGTVYSMIGASLLPDLLEGTAPDVTAQIVTPNRKAPEKGGRSVIS